MGNPHLLGDSYRSFQNGGNCRILDVSRETQIPQFATMFHVKQTEKVLDGGFEGSENSSVRGRMLIDRFVLQYCRMGAFLLLAEVERWRSKQAHLP